MLSTELIKKIKRLEIKTSRLVEGSIAGSYLSTFKGRGIEFSEVREYAEGDDVRTIDWNVTARMGAPFIKTFMEERDLTVILAVDVSPSMEFGTTTQSKRELAVDFCAAAALVAVGNNDRVGLLCYTDRVEAFVPPRKGKRHAMRLLMELFTIEPTGRGTDNSLAAGYLMRTLKHRSTLFFVSDFVEAGGRPKLKALSRRHEVVPVLLNDRRDTDMPPVGLVEFADPETGRRALVDTSSGGFRAAYAAESEKRDLARKSLFRALKAEPVELWTGSSPIKPLVRYFRRQSKRRRR